MNKLKLVLLLSLISLGAKSQVGQIQQIKIVSFTVKNQLPAVIDNWNNVPGALLLVAQKPPTIRVEGVRLVLQIRSNGAMICGNNAVNGLPVDNFTTRTFSAAELTGILSGCHDLKDGTYSLCAQFFNIDKVAISNEVCKEFTVETPKETDYAPPTLITPDNGKEFASTDMIKPVMFRWTPLVPKPHDPVSYRLKVWQLMQGQNGTQAMRSNQPIVVKDVDNITQAVVNNLWNGPCKPPYLCDFIWNVQAMNREGHPLGRNEGTSEPYTFKVKENETPATVKNIFPEDQKQVSPDEAIKPITFRWTAVVPKPSEPVMYRMKVWQLMQGQNGSQAMRTNQPIVTKDVDNITQAVVNNLYTGPCRPPYLCDFIWIVEATTRNAAGATPQVIASSEPTIFKVKEDETPATIKNVFPEDQKQFAAGEAIKPITFKWTALVPKPGDPVTYRMKVWQLMQGQNGSTAMRTNKPIVTKDICCDVTEASVNGIWTGPCKPPYLCDYIWVVEASTRNAAGSEPKVIATSEPTMFMVTQYIIQLDSLKVSCTAKANQYSFSMIITNLNNSVAELVSVGVNSSVPPGATIAGFTPPVGTTITASGGTLTVTGTINSSLPLTNICIKAKIQKQGDPGKNAEDYLCDSVKPCKCDACDEKKVNINIPPPNNIVINGNNTITLNQPVTITTTPPKLVKSIKAELVYFEFVPESEDCLPCNKDSKTFGNFDNGTHEQLWSYTPPKNFSNAVTLTSTVTLPPTVKCCDATIRWCIRYVVTFDDCTTCNKLVCYEKKKEGCAKGNPIPDKQ